MKINLKKTNIMYIDTKLEVPYFSQYLDIDDKENALKSCGITCTYMALKYFNKKIPNINEMVNEGIKTGGFGKSGWFHQYFIDIFTRYNLISEKRENMRDIDVNLISESINLGNPVIISAERKLFDKRIFHNVLIVGIRADEKDNLIGFYYHDPASLSVKTGEYCYVPLDTFYLSWRKMAIFAKQN